MSRTSIELNWLSRRDKQISLPVLVFGSLDSAQGTCYPPWWGEVEIDGVIYSLDKGLIVVDPVKSDNVASCLAHEWRHHWQHMRGWDSPVIPHSFNDPDQYWLTIRHYFRSQPHEMDALLFELSIEPSELAKQFWDVSK